MSNLNSDLSACMSVVPSKGAMLKTTMTTIPTTKVRPWDKIRNITKNGYVYQHIHNSSSQAAGSTNAWDEPYADR